MINPPEHRNLHLASSWAAGIALLFLGIGVQGGLSPLVPTARTEIARIETDGEVMIESFEPPAAQALEDSAEPEPERLVEDFEIPPLPKLVEPLTPPEMVELTPLEEVIERPATPEVMPPKPQPKPMAKPVAKAKPGNEPSPVAGKSSAKSGVGGGSTAKAGSGKGSFPHPSYPSSARNAGLQGTVRLRVVVASNGLPSSVSVSSSSGHAVLDAAARDHVRRRWRWPSGTAKSYNVPIKFVLQ